MGLLRSWSKSLWLPKRKSPNQCLGGFDRLRLRRVGTLEVVFCWLPKRKKMLLGNFPWVVETQGWSSFS